MSEKIFTIKNDFFNVPVTLDCGQSFRWTENENGDWQGIAFGKKLTVHQDGENITLIGADEKDYREIWEKYFDLERDYKKICESFSGDKMLREAVKAYPGIRILRQEPWEALCSFIISQNNNIPRIKGIIERLCALAGEDLGNGDYAFPSPEKVLELGVEGLAPIRSGFRAKYIIDAARKVSDGTVNFEFIDSLPLEEAAEELKKIKGVGDKVAACTLLYGFGKADSFPVDVWVKRILAETYPNGLPECTAGVSGIAQQYLFHYRRTVNP